MASASGMTERLSGGSHERMDGVTELADTGHTDRHLLCGRRSAGGDAQLRRKELAPAGWAEPAAPAPWPDGPARELPGAPQLPWRALWAMEAKEPGGRAPRRLPPPCLPPPGVPDLTHRGGFKGPPAGADSGAAATAALSLGAVGALGRASHLPRAPTGIHSPGPGSAGRCTAWPR